MHDRFTERGCIAARQDVIVAQYVRGSAFLQQRTQRPCAAKARVDVFHIASAGAELNRRCLLCFVVCPWRSVSQSNDGKTGNENNDSTDSQSCPTNLLNHVFLLAAFGSLGAIHDDCKPPTNYPRAARQSGISFLTSKTAPVYAHLARW